MKSGDYWKERFSALEDAQHQYGLETFREVEPAFEKAQREIQSQIEVWYSRYAKNNGISMAEARRQLSASELKELRWDVNEYIKHGRENAIDGRWMKELENASAKFHINRLEALKLRTQQAYEKAFGNELDAVDRMMGKLYQNGYYHTCFEIQKGFHIGWGIGQIDERKLNKVISKPWTADGRNFSDRIWQSKTRMVNELHQQLTRTILQGKAPDAAIKHMTKFLQDKTKNAKYQAGRLVMTEQAFISSAAQRDAFSDLDVDEFQVVATLDSITSEICQEMDLQHFPMKEYQIGVTAPPFHPNCRSVTVPYFEDDFGVVGERAARGEDGKTYYVPADMTYKEWKKSFVDGDGGLSTKIGGNGIPLHDEPVLLKSNVKDISEEIRKYEINAMKEATETALVYTKEGELFKCFGVEGRVFPDSDLCGKIVGATISHNHPMSVTEYSFSNDDIELFEEYDLDVLRGCDELYTYELTRNALEVDDEPDEWMNEYNFRHAQVIYIARERGIGYRRWLNDKGRS